ncbi:MAG: methionine synthase [Anaerolineales bacterium]|nr:methionine synthase [Anaerolineales bacterium]
MNLIRTILQEKGVLLADGGMGTMLFNAGLKAVEAPERWNLTHPDRVAAIHREYMEAGSRVLLTNTFGGNPFRLASKGPDLSVDEVNHAAVKVLHDVVKNSEKQILIAGDIGPSGQMLTPYGNLSFEEAASGFAEQAGALIAGGVDLIWIETMADLEEVRAAVGGTRQISHDIPIVITMTFDSKGRTLMGVSPAEAASTLLSYGAVAVGGNCGKGPEEIVTSIKEMRDAEPEAVLVAKANAGIPTLVDGKPEYRADPSVMADYAVEVHKAGAQIIGACCGSTPAHIKAMAEALEMDA